MANDLLEVLTRSMDMNVIQRAIMFGIFLVDGARRSEA
jgi:hypothetical protein